MKLVLPYPHKDLNPNKRVHWSKKHKLAHDLRYHCKILARGSKPVPDADGKLNLTFTFYPPDNRRRDLDNVIAAFKAGFDGLADAWGVDDRHFRPTFSWGKREGFCGVEVVL